VVRLLVERPQLERFIVERLLLERPVLERVVVEREQLVG
jgi:hypothetical protein